MKVAWASHRSWDPDVIGGAEICDRLMLSRRPGDVEVTLFARGFSDSPESRRVLEEADRVIVSGFRFPPDELRLFAAKQPLLWIHDIEYETHPINDFASDIVCMTPAHLKRQEAQLRRSLDWPGPRVAVCPGWFDTAPFFDGRYVPPGARGETALWAHRMQTSKNMFGARTWAEEHGWELRLMSARPREEVIEAMLKTKYFILLSLDLFDAGPWSVIESQLAGCIPVVNENVGWFDLPRDEIRDLIDHGNERFWNIVRDY